MAQPIKIIIVGDASVGKSMFASRYISGLFSMDVLPTLGTDFFSKRTIIDDKEYELQIWDTSGQEKFGSALTSGYYRSAKGCLLIYSIDSMPSFKDLPKWLIDLDRYTTEPHFVRVLVGNKCDLERLREVPHDEAETFAKQFGLEFIEASAKENTNVDEAFALLARTIIKEKSSPTTPTPPAASPQHQLRLPTQSAAPKKQEPRKEEPIKLTSNQAQTDDTEKCCG